MTEQRRERGATLVEFAVVIPVFMMLIIGLFTGANLVNRKIQVSHAARNGASFGASLNLQTDWASAVQTKIASTATGDFTKDDICVALVTGTGDTPALVKPGDVLDPSTRVVVRINAKGSLDWVFNSMDQTWKSTSTALWEPYAQYSGSTGVSSGMTLTTSGTDPTCQGNDAAKPNDYAFVPGDTPSTTTTLPPPTTQPCTNNVDMTSLEGVTRTVSGSPGDLGTTLTTTRGGCNAAVKVSWTVSTVANAYSGSGNNQDNGPAMFDNLTTANTSWGLGTPVVMLSNLPSSHAANNPTRYNSGQMDVTLNFSTEVTDLSFDVMHLQHQRATSSERYSTFSFLSVKNSAGEIPGARNLIYTGTTSGCQYRRVQASASPRVWNTGALSPCGPLGIFYNGATGAPDGTWQRAWASYDPGNVGGELAETVSNVKFTFTKGIKSLTLQFGIVNSQDGDTAGWTWGTSSIAPLNLNGSPVAPVCTNSKFAMNPAWGNPCLQIGLANMKFKLP